MRHVLRGVIFDLDGVLVTTDGFHYRAWKELADELGLAFDEKVNQRLRGVSRQESLRNIYDHNRKPLPTDDVFRGYCDRKNRRYVELVGGMSPVDVLPGALRLLGIKPDAPFNNVVLPPPDTPVVREEV